jgi:excisionase family DNA binding protein
MMLTPKIAAEKIKCSIGLVYQLCREGSLPCFRIGGRRKRGKLLIREDELEAFLSRCRQGAAEASGSNAKAGDTHGN